MVCSGLVAAEDEDIRLAGSDERKSLDRFHNCSRLKQKYFRNFH